MFDLINEVAVIGTTFLMMAIGTIWYSNLLFGNFLSSKKESAQKKDSKLEVLVTFASYFVMLSVLAYILVVSPLLDISRGVVLGSVCMFVTALLASLYAFEQKSLRDFLITAGFYVLFVTGGGLVLTYWPW